MVFITRSGAALGTGLSAEDPVERESAERSGRPVSCRASTQHAAGRRNCVARTRISRPPRMGWDAKRIMERLLLSELTANPKNVPEEVRAGRDLRGRSI